MSGFVALHIRPLRTHPVRALLSIGGVAVGIALMVAMLGMFGSMGGAAGKLANLAGDADVEVSAPNDGGLDPALIEQVGAVPGVAVAAPIIRSTVSVDGKALLLFGLDPRLADIGGGIDPKACLPKDIKAGEGILIGPAVDATQAVTIASTATTTRVAVLGRVTCAAARNLNAGRFIAAAFEPASRWTNRAGRPDAIEVKATPGQAAAVTAALTTQFSDRAVVASPRLLAAQGRAATKVFQQASSIMVGLALVVGAFCVFNTVSMTALERRRELATLRAVGGRRRALLRDFLAEMTILGVIGSIVGLYLGRVVGTQLLKQVPPILIDTVGVQPSFEVSGNVAIFSLLAGTLVTIGAALLPARAAVSIEPVEAMRSEGPSESVDFDQRGALVMFIVGVVAYVVAVVATVTTKSDGVVLAGFSTIVVAALIFQYGGRAQIAAGTARVASWFGNSGRLAAASIARSPRRTYATVSAVTVAVITVVAIGGVTENQIASFTKPYKPMAKSDVWIGTAEPKVIPVTLRFPRALVDEVARVPGVAKAIGAQSAYATIGKDRVLVQGFDGLSNMMSFAVLSPEANAKVLDAAHPAIAVTQAFADLQHLKVGDAVTLPTPDGPLTLPIVAINEAVAPTQSGVITMSLDVMERAFRRDGVTTIEAFAAPGVSRAALKARLEAALRHSPVRAYFATGDEEYAGAKGAITSSTALISAMEVAVVLCTAFALSNALTISVLERKRELGIVRAIGTTRLQIFSMIIFEAVAIAFMGVALGFWQGLIQHRVGDIAVKSLLNAKIDYLFTIEPLVIVTLAVTGIALVSGLLPALRAGRTNVIEAIGYE